MRKNKHRVYVAKKFTRAINALGEAVVVRGGRDTTPIMDRVRSAVEAGAKPDAWALKWALFDLDIARLLLEHGADPAAPEIHGVFLLDSPLVATLRRPPDDPHREKILDLFREYAPEAVMEAYCTQRR